MNFFMKKLMEAKMRDVPPAERDKVFAMFEKDPDFFQKIATEVKVEMDKGKDQMKATMEVMQRHEDQLKTIAADLKQ